MDVASTEFPGLLVITPKVFKDERGFFLESYSRACYAAAGIDYDFVQDNHARSERKGVLRGLHFQAPPSAQAKLVWVVRGAVYDLVLDLRKGSPTFGRHAGFILSADNFARLMVPGGFAHGYLTLEEGTEVMYKVDAPYDPERDGGIIWNDPDLAIDWPLDEPLLSPKDRRLPRFKDFDSPFVYAERPQWKVTP